MTASAPSRNADIQPTPTRETLSGRVQVHDDRLHNHEVHLGKIQQVIDRLIDQVNVLRAEIGFDTLDIQHYYDDKGI